MTVQRVNLPTPVARSNEIEHRGRDKFILQNLSKKVSIRV